MHFKKSAFTICPSGNTILDVCWHKIEVVLMVWCDKNASNVKSNKTGQNLDEKSMLIFSAHSSLHDIAARQFGPLVIAYQSHEFQIFYVVEHCGSWGGGLIFLVLK